MISLEQTAGPHIDDSKIDLAIPLIQCHGARWLGGCHPSHGGFPISLSQAASRAVMILWSHSIAPNLSCYRDVGVACVLQVSETGLHLLQSVNKKRMNEVSSTDRGVDSLQSLSLRPNCPTSLGANFDPVPWLRSQVLLSGHKIT